MTETHLKINVMRMIKKEFPDIWYYKSNDNFRSGLPDLIMNVCGYFVAIELKFGKNDATPLQNHELFCIRKAGGVAEVARSVEEVKRILKAIIERR